MVSQSKCSKKPLSLSLISLLLFSLKKPQPLLLIFGLLSTIALNLFIFASFLFLITNEIYSLNIRVILFIYQIQSTHMLSFKVSHGESLKSCYQSIVKTCMMSSRVLVMLIQTIVSNLSLFQIHQIKRPIGGGYQAAM